MEFMFGIVGDHFGRAPEIVLNEKVQGLGKVGAWILTNPIPP